MDLMVSLFRALAYELRLRIHYCTVTEPGLTVGEVAQRLSIVQPIVSAEVGGLADLGLVDTRPSGRRVHIHPPARGLPPDSLTRSVHLSLTKLWREHHGGNPIHSYVWDCSDAPRVSPAGDWDALAARLIFFFTGYTHLRRLLVLRHLREYGDTSRERLVEAIGMSPSAVGRQLQKLRRRGLVESITTGQSRSWRLVASPGPPFQRDLHGQVMRALPRESASS